MQRNHVRIDATPLLEHWAQLGDALVHPDDHRHMTPGGFATDLQPVPWVGPIATADVYLLFLNPGHSPDDLPYERSRADFVQTLQENRAGRAPYFYLLDRLADHPGHRWARATFGSDLTQDDLKRFCVLQLVPYHSKEGAVARSVAKGLPSSIAIRDFVRTSVLPAARNGDVALIVARSSRLWGVDDAEECESIVVYRGGECRRAFMRPNTRGGRLLRQRLVARKGTQGSHL